MLFTWDPNKAIVNFRKHRIAFEEAVAVFSDPLALYITDDSHSDRAILIGESIKRRLLLVVFIDKADQEIRIISARRATAHERKRYEEGS
jgi:uncharacterized DUF497 family protein